MTSPGLWVVMLKFYVRTPRFKTYNTVMSSVLASSEEAAVATAIRSRAEEKGKLIEQIAFRLDNETIRKAYQQLEQQG